MLSSYWMATFRPDGQSAAILIPPAFGLAGVNLHTWTGWGSVTHWNAFVANLEMHGKGTFFDTGKLISLILPRGHLYFTGRPVVMY